MTKPAAAADASRVRPETESEIIFYLLEKCEGSRTVLFF